MNYAIAVAIIIVQNVVGLPENEAREVIGDRLGNVHRATSPTVPAGIVMAQSIMGGTVSGTEKSLAEQLTDLAQQIATLEALVDPLKAENLELKAKILAAKEALQ